jgi:hypothetical protein
MPRQSTERKPRHRAPRRIDDSGRRVRVSHAISAARSALATSRPHAEQAPPPSPDPRPASRPARPPRRVRPPGRPRGSRPGGRPAAAGSGLLREAARSLLVTPWFAAGTGFVVAAGLWIYSPHTELRFPDAAPGVSLCPSAGCATDPGRGAGSLTATTPGTHISSPAARSRHSARPTVSRHHAASSGLVFKFTVLWQRHGSFGAAITVSGHQVPKAWQLSFDLPGVRIGYVMGVSWRTSASGDGGVASPLILPSGGGPGGGGPSGGPGPTGFGPSGRQHAHGAVIPVISFVITGSGSTAAPADCVFDGAACTFG